MRVGLVHAASNAVALSLYAAALVQRARGGRGRLLSLAGGAVAGAGAILGGHLGYRQATGANHGEEIAHVGPENWQSLGPLAEVPVGKPVRRVAGDVPVFVLRQAGSERRRTRRHQRPVRPLPAPVGPAARGRRRRRRRRGAHRVPVARQRVPGGRRVRGARAGDGPGPALRVAGGGRRPAGAGRQDPRGARLTLSAPGGERGFDGDPQAQPVVGEPLPRRRDQLVEPLRPVGDRGHQRGPGAQHRDVEDDLAGTVGEHRARAGVQQRRAQAVGSRVVCTCTAEQSSASATTAPSASSRTIIPPILHGRCGRAPCTGLPAQRGAGGPGPSRAAPRRPGRPGSRTRCPPPTRTGPPPAPRW